MGAYEDQIIANANAIQQIINQAKLIPQLPDLDETLGVNSEIPIYNTNGVVTGKINLTELADIIGSIIGVTLGWRWIEGSNVEKDGGNSNNSVLEVNDEVYFKKIKQNKKNQIIIYTDVKNEIRKIQHHWKQKNTYKNKKYTYENRICSFVFDHLQKTAHR